VQEGHPVCKKTEWWGAGVVIYLEPGANLHTAQLMPLPLTVSCFSKIQIGFAFLVPAHPGNPGQTGVKRVYVYCTVHLCGMLKLIQKPSVVYLNKNKNKKITHTHTRLTALCPGLPR